MANPRIEDLRKRIEKDPGSRLFAQLAEELRKDGELEDAIRVARTGLQSHPNYPSARMTLGRSLLDTGDWAAARIEFELVLKGAADNILASRYLAECLESLGERDAAVAQYRKTLAMAPGEKHVLARLQALEGGGKATVPPVAAKPAAAAATAPGLRPATPTAAPAAGRALRPPSAPPPPAPMTATPSLAPPPPAPAPPPPPPPIPLATVEGEMELETSRSAPAPAAPAAPSDASPMAPIPLVDADEDFELERPYESPATSIVPAAAEEEFELEAPHEVPSTAWTPSIPPLPVMDEPAPPPPPAFRPAPAAEAPPAEAPAAEAPAPPAARGPSTLTSPTLGELYFNQGFTDRAIEVYRELSLREPGNERVSARLRELEKLQGALSGAGPAAAAAPSIPSTPGATDEAATADAAPSSEGAPADRRQAIERTIVRLEGLLSAIRKG